ncbi:MAG: hypothetical protein TR69_WS6001000866 [candidate division WS6 bacterium OLB20]|uniref:Uncharacterized protein n=1 Tax=candidate division WS6 bacterium OLB20 TaxID=1617426 RepID=A0A136LYX2_9BACT|nr:MAG: hypothetical protein TR69_WS6001000866 [candidate division WS6 bacterium OLB20]
MTAEGKTLTQTRETASILEQRAREFITERERMFEGLATISWSYDEDPQTQLPRIDRSSKRVLLPVLSGVLKEGFDAVERGEDRYDYEVMHAYLSHVRDNIMTADRMRRRLPEQGKISDEDYAEFMDSKYSKYALKYTAVSLGNIVDTLFRDDDTSLVMTPGALDAILDFSREAGMEIDDFADDLNTIPLPNAGDGQNVTRPDVFSTQNIQQLDLKTIDRALEERTITPEEHDRLTKQIKGHYARKLIEHLKKDEKEEENKPTAEPAAV